LRHKLVLALRENERVGVARAHAAQPAINGA
jgi:hypothetical protein